MTTLITAIIFLPAELSLDGELTRHCIAHVENRGYRLLSILRHWQEVEEVVYIKRLAQVVVLARGEHLPLDRLPRIECAGPADLEPAGMAGHRAHLV